MKNYSNRINNNSHTSLTANKNGVIPNSFKFISSCIKSVSSNVRSASASVASSISGDSEVHRDQVLWASFDRLELGPSSFRSVLLLGYSNGFQILDVQDASNVSELVSRRDYPVTFLQMQPIPEKSGGHEGFRASHPVLLVVTGDEAKSSGPLGVRDGLMRDGYMEAQMGNLASPNAVRFYSLRSHNYVHVLRFRSTVYMIRCSPRVVAVGLATQIHCFDALTLENKFSVLTYPLPQLGGQGMVGVNIGYGPMAVGPRWLAYASNNPLQSNTGRLSPQSLTASPGVSPSTSPGTGNLVARYAMESSKHLASGIINLGDMGYKTLSKYCQDFLPDGSSPPVSSNSSWKMGRVAGHSADSDTAGMVVIKDIVSKSVVSQFKAHTSPISALCFDPSGTLLVTASIHGNNINIFRIMPSSVKNGSGLHGYNWSSSHVHLYKLHRGFTSAVIQDISFSHYSQWISIISSRGTCHIYVLSPFGGDTGLEVKKSHVDRTTLVPVLSQPWWSTPSLMITQQPFLRPPSSPISLSVISRIKCCNSGWLHTISNAASTAAGKVSIPSGALSAVFRSCLPQNLHQKVVPLEHLLAYTPSGHLTQYELFPSMGGEQSETSRMESGSVAALQDEELKVKFEPVQWWDVCRRKDWPEREECISGVTLGRQDTGKTFTYTSDCDENDNVEEDSIKPQDRSHWYLSNAEVHINSGRVPIWQNTKIYFYTVGRLDATELNLIGENSGGETEIERMPVDEVELRRKDLLPVFTYFHSIQPDSVDRGLEGRFPPTLSQAEKHKFVGGAMSSSLGSPRKDTMIDQFDAANNYPAILRTKGQNERRTVQSGITSSLLNENVSNSYNVLSSPEECPLDGNCVTKSMSSSKGGSHPVGRIISKEVESPSSSTSNEETAHIGSNDSDLSINTVDEGKPREQLDFEHYFQEEYCKATTLERSHESSEIIADSESSNSFRNVSKSEDDDDMLGAVFSFSEEG